MNLTIFGASRGVGRKAVDVAVARGHRVTAVARSSGSLNGSPARAIVGDVLDDGVVHAALADCNAVLVALGTAPSRRPSADQRFVCSRGTRAILTAMNGTSVQRIVVVSSYGVGPTRTMRPFPFNLVAATLLREVMDDKEVAERDVRESATDWTIVQPLGLTDAPASGTPFVSTTGARRSSRISRADVAAVCIEAFESQQFVRQSVAVSA